MNMVWAGNVEKDHLELDCRKLTETCTVVTACNNEYPKNNIRNHH